MTSSNSSKTPTQKTAASAKTRTASTTAGTATSKTKAQLPPPDKQDDPVANAIKERMHAKLLALTPTQVQSLQEDQERFLNTTTTVNFRMTYRDLEVLERRCQGTTRSDFLRSLILGLPTPTTKQVMSKTDRMTFVELSRIGNNLNQLARALNALVKHNLYPENDEVASIQEKLEQLRQETKLLRVMLSRGDAATSTNLPPQSGKGNPKSGKGVNHD